MENNRSFPPVTAIGVFVYDLLLHEKHVAQENLIEANRINSHHL